MSATPTTGQRPGRGQPDWLQRKYGRPPANPKLAAWAGQALDQIYGVWDRPVPIGPYPSKDAAWAAKNALYDATYKRWNRAHPDEPLSLSANVTDPADGKCYARGQERCTQNGCQPTPGGYYIHARLYDKKDGRAHQGAKPRDQWDYDPLAPRPRQHRASGDDTAEPAAPGRDPAPAHLRRFGVTAPSGRDKPGKPGDAKARGGEPPQEGILGRLRRTLG
jgi:hypothetical protein